MIKIAKKVKNTESKMLNRSLWGNIIMLVFLLIFGLFTAIPIVYTGISAFKPINELFLYPPRFFVKNPTFENFTAIINILAQVRVPFERYIFNTLFITLLGTTLYIIFAAMAAYPLAKHNFKGKILVLNIVILSMLFRPEVTAIPQYIIISKLNLLNTYIAVLLPALATTMGVFLMRQFMLNFVPDQIVEAAKIDGAGELFIFWRIVMPMVKPAWITLMIFTFQGLWNTTGTQFIYEEQMKMLPIALQQLTTGGISRAGTASAVALILLIPPVILFVTAQNSVMETMAHSGIK